ncbi:MAG: hypothetical protein KF845_14885 [Cyclobacteriaceae bacterium]|nr:hypothetical protein [Cyclobacteriaceae bacterium]
MVSELRKAIKKAEKLPEDKQKALADIILDEIQWDISFQNSQDKLMFLAEEALVEYKAKKTKPLKLD